MPAVSEEESLALQDQVVLSAVLTSLRDTSSAVKTVAKLPEIAFSKNGKDFQTYEEMGKESFTDQALLHHVRIDTPSGQTRYFQKITSEALDTMTDIKHPDNKTGFKGAAWYETDKDGQLLVEQGKKKVFLAFEGYNGNPVEKNPTPQTASMYAVGDGDLYPPTTQVRAFVEEVKEVAGNNIEAHIVTHSMGSANGTVAAIACDCEGIAVVSHTQLEPVAASLAIRKLTETFKGDGELHATQVTLKSQFPEVTADRFDAITQPLVEDINAIRAVKFKKGYFTKTVTTGFTSSALLETYKPKEGDDLTLGENGVPIAKQQVRLKNINASLVGKRVSFDAAGEPLFDSDNTLIGGEQYYMDMTGFTTFGTSFGAKMDPMHVTGSLCKEACDEKSPPVFGKTLQDVKEARAAQQEVQKKNNKTTDDKMSALIPDELHQTFAAMQSQMGSEPTGAGTHGLDGIAATMTNKDGNYRV